MFIVVTLVADRPSARRDANAGIATFSTPTMVHLTSAFIISTIMSAPWPARFEPGAAGDVVAVAGIVYALYVIRRARDLQAYHAGVDDWVWYFIMPLVAYVLLFVSTLSLAAWPVAPFLVGTATVGLICIGIHNAWDVVTYLAMSDRDE